MSHRILVTYSGMISERFKSHFVQCCKNGMSSGFVRGFQRLLLEVSKYKQSGPLKLQNNRKQKGSIRSGIFPIVSASETYMKLTIKSISACKQNFLKQEDLCEAYHFSLNKSFRIYHDNLNIMLFPIALHQHKLQMDTAHNQIFNFNTYTTTSKVQSNIGNTVTKPG